MHNLPFKALYTFCMVARYNNFQEAAQVLFITPSAVSHQIKNLERHLGCALFIRKGNRLQILPHAEQLVSVLKASFSEINFACNALQASAPTQKLVIAAIPSIATCWLIPKLKYFQRLQPQIDLHITYAMHGNKIDFNEIDIAFVYAKTPQKISGVNTHLFRSAKSYPVCSAQFYATQNTQGIDIAKGPFLQDSHISDGWVKWFKKAGLYVEHCQLGLAFDDFNLLRAAALSGQGIALCAKALIADDLACNRLVQLSDVSINQEAGYYLLHKQHSEVERQRQSQVFVDWAINY